MSLKSGFSLTRKLIPSVALVAAAGLYGPLASAQASSSDIDDMKRQIQEMQRKIDSMQAAQASHPARAP